MSFEVEKKKLDTIRLLLDDMGTFKQNGILDKSMRISLFTILALIKKRVFNDNGGKNSLGSEFGYYKTYSYLLRVEKFNRNNKKINLVATGELSREFRLGSNGKEYRLGFATSANGNTENPNAAQKAKQMENRFGLIFQLSEKEIRIYNVIFAKELQKMINGNF